MASYSFCGVQRGVETRGWCPCTRQGAGQLRPTRDAAPHETGAWNNSIFHGAWWKRNRS